MLKHSQTPLGCRQEGPNSRVFMQTVAAYLLQPANSHFFHETQLP